MYPRGVKKRFLASASFGVDERFAKVSKRENIND